MIDYTQRRVYGHTSEYLDQFNIQALRDEDDVFQGYIDYSDGPIQTKVICPNNGSEPYLKQTGSLHKYWEWMQTGKEQNYSDFNYTSLCKTLDYISKKYPFALVGKLENLEYGININTSFDVKDFLENNLLLFKDRTRTKQKNYNNGAMYLEWETTNYYLKIYDKGRQFNRKKNILRLEIKYKTNRGIKNVGINNLEDLKDREKLKSLNSELLEKIAACTIIDDTNYSFNNRKDKSTFDLFNSSRKIKHLRKTKTRQTVKNKRDEFEGLVFRHELGTKKTEIIKAINDKFNELIVDEYHEIKPLDHKYPNLTNTTIHITGKRKPTQPRQGLLDFPLQIATVQGKRYSKRRSEDIPKTDQYHVKKLRNDKSNKVHNLIRDIKKKVDHLERLVGAEDLKKMVRLQPHQLELLEDNRYLNKCDRLLTKIGL